MTGITWTAIVVGLTVAIYILDAMPKYRPIVDALPEPETDDDAGDDAPAGFVTDADVRELAEIGGCMIDGRHDVARYRFENWLDDLEPDWRSLR